MTPIQPTIRAAIRAALADKPARERGGRAGDTPWEALSHAVEDIVNPLEAGTANHKVSRDGDGGRS